MKIAHIVSTFPPYAGGIGNTCLYEAKELAKLGHEVTVFTPSQKSWFLSEKIKIRYLKPIFKYGNAAFVPQIVFLLGRFDIIYLHWPFIGAESILLAKRFSWIKKPLIVRYQMDLRDRGLRGAFFNLYSLFFIPLLIKAADKILVSSFDYAKHSKIKKYMGTVPIRGQSPEFIEVPLGVDAEKFFPQPKNRELLKKHNLTSEDKIILFVGGLDRAHYFKGVEVLLRAVAGLRLKIKDLRLLIVGEGDLKPKYKRLAGDLGIGDRVIFAGKVSDEELPGYYNLADVFVLPSTDSSEAFGLVLLEAMASAKPVVVSDLPGSRILAAGSGLVAKVGDKYGLGQKISLLLQNEKLARQFGQSGRKKVLEKYNWHALAKQLERIYTES